MHPEDIQAASSTDALADMYAAWLSDNGLPNECAESLLLSVMDWRETLNLFIARWNVVQDQEDSERLWAARGESI